MTEISMPGDVSPSRPSGGSKRNMMIAIVVIVIIGGAAIGFTLLNTNTEPAWESRSLWTRTGMDPVLYPYYYADEFDLDSEHVESDLPPEVHFTIDIDPGSDTETIMTLIAVYDMDLDDFDASDWTERNSEELDYAYEENSYSVILELPQSTGTYTWCVYLYLPLGEKSSTWSVDVEIRLKHYPVW
jgi:hypothetical protein